MIVPAPVPLSQRDDEHVSFTENLKREISKQRVSIFLRANADIICKYWYIGNSILEEQKQCGWAAKVVDCISYVLRKAFPDAEGFPPRN